MRQIGLVMLLAVLGFAGVYVVRSPGPAVAALASMNCQIKGNVSYNGDEHIFHVPGQPDYDSTVISASRGERWFCSEAEAINAGWRKARN